ncbi:hypothetical protein A9Q84_14080 [Halobacteriovorax marinus]|mgnify:CR=1 FL=1|uniref:Cyclic nucleotide-binding domain-containing protein n=1 Tax=Halobacteriovorax marinus TaxID=97084 RepID=A0A1Y5F501_9BACT|nr:hypothetical protein A9Q84_14080 [Halobacteriovorax marinus]
MSNIIRQALGQICNITDEEWNKLLPFIKTRSIKKNHVLLEQGSKSINFYFITKGLVRFYYSTPEGKEFNKSFHHENDFVGSLLTMKRDMPSTFSIQALEDCELIVINYKEFNTLYDEHRCWDRIGRIMAEELAIRKELREKEFLLDSAEARYESFKAEFPDLQNRINLGHIASYLGITQVQLSRIRKNIK